MMKVGEFLVGPKHKPAERTAIYEPTTQSLLTDESGILKATLKYNVGVLTKNKVQPQDLKEVQDKNELHESIMASAEKKFSELLEGKTWRRVLKHLKKRNKKFFRHITKAGQDFQDTMFDYMADLIFYEMVPDTYDYTKLFGLWKGKGSKLDLNMMRYIHGKYWDAKVL